jgi:hypothetical protein
MTGSVPIDRDVPNAARIYHYFLGGSNYYPVDERAAAEATAGWIEEARTQTRAHRDFLVRAVRYLVEEAGVRQFLDIGTGIPDEDNVAATAQASAPECRIVSVDNDPTVVAHAADLLTSTPEGATAFVDGDLRRPAKILREARETLDFDRPIAVMLVAILHFFPERDDPAGIVRRFLAAVPSGSYLAVSHLAGDIEPHVQDVGRMVRAFNARTRETFVLRSRPEVAALLDGLEIVGPGIVPLASWRPDIPSPTSAPHWAAIGRKP